MKKLKQGVEKAKKLFFHQSEKTTVKKEAASLALVAFMVAALAASKILQKPQSAHVAVVNVKKPFASEDQFPESPPRVALKSPFLADYRKIRKAEKAKPRPRRVVKARQAVISNRPDRPLPAGSILMGKLLTPVDTRYSGPIRAVLPHHVVYRGQRILAKGTIFLGQMRYRGGKKVFIEFTRMLDPFGKEFPVEARALDVKKHTAGIEGAYRSAFGKRVTAPIGLGMASGITEALTQREAVGGHYVAPKANLKNSFYHGLSRATNEEARRRAQAAHKKAYVTVGAGTGLMIFLEAPLALRGRSL